MLKKSGLMDYKFLTVLSLSVLVASGCSDDEIFEPLLVDDESAGTGGQLPSTITTVGTANCPSLLGSGDASGIAGLYELTGDTVPTESEWYMEIQNNGAVTSYFYDPDQTMQGNSCYNIVPGQTVFSPLGNDIFLSVSYIDTDVNCDTFSETLTILRDESKISIAFVDFDDEDGDGDTSELLTVNLPIAVGITSESFNLCDRVVN